ncbi:MAG: helix-turn-helix domain-containing protein [Nitrososphaerales archaeon]
MKRERGELKGTTLRVYKYLLRAREPLGVSDIQRGLNLSSPSVAFYHITKLTDMGLIRSEGTGYIVDKIVLSNIIRFKGLLIPKYFFFLIFFTLAFILNIFLFRPDFLSPQYIFSLLIILVALALFTYETLKILKSYY